MDRSEAAARARTRSIPDGVYEAESFMDDDGISIGKRIPIKVRVTVKGEEMTVDLTEVSRQVRGFYNSGITTGYACAQVAYKCLTSPTDYPINDGSFRSLHVIVPEGRVISAKRPAPMRLWMTFPMTIVDTIFKALAPAIPDRVIAGHHADLLIAQFHGINTKTSEFFLGNFGPLGGGWGAKMTEDGVSGTVALNDGDTHNSPNELIEAKFPLVIERYALVPDSGGAGRHRGGLGVERVVRARSHVTVNTQIDRAHCRPWGLGGGGDGKGNSVALRIDGAWKTDFPNAKVLVAQVKAGDAFRLRSGGGGGYGSPLTRPVGRRTQRRAAGLRLGGRGGDALWRRRRSRDVRGGRRGDRAASCCARGLAGDGRGERVTARARSARYFNCASWPGLSRPPRSGSTEISKYGKPACPMIGVAGTSPAMTPCWCDRAERGHAETSKRNPAPSCAHRGRCYVTEPSS